METFESYRPLLFSIAYRMLGSAMEAEDIVQEAYLRFQSAGQVQSPKAYLSTVVTRLCLDHLKSARVQRETYIGPWLPEPLPTGDSAFPEQVAGLSESLSMAFLVLLESLSPVERAVFLLREVFDYDYAEIARIVERDEATCRQLFSRAKKHISDSRPRYTSSPEEHNRLLASFLQAAEQGEMNSLMALLAQDVTLWSDGGCKVRAATRPIHGREAVARFLLGIRRFAEGRERVELMNINGAAGFVLRAADGRPLYVFTLETGSGLIRALRVVGNPDKIARFKPPE
ncbi:MAG: RNA polymerase sigma-70 factor [Chloroflexi bacterium]|nr:RNA polymerase sigma-70 factor [Chloroflexota bacterium]